jgi:hypothetical protein
MRRLKLSALTILISLGLAVPVLSQEDATFKGRDTTYEPRPPYIVTGVGPVDDEPCWYCPEVDAPYAPTFEVLDTDAAKGRYYMMTKTITFPTASTTERI